MQSHIRLGLVCAANDIQVLNKCLLASPDLKAANIPIFVVFNVASAAEAYATAAASVVAVDWWIWVHQDVFLPAGWIENFKYQISLACRQWSNLAVVGSYGLTPDWQRAGRLLDRGQLLQESFPLPCLARSFDEHLIALRANANLSFDPRLGFDLYATDVALMAEQGGFCSAVLDLYCEHWSGTPRIPPFPDSLVARYRKSAVYFEQKWQPQLPIHTPCMAFCRPGSAAEQCDALLP